MKLLLLLFLTAALAPLGRADEPAPPEASRPVKSPASDSEDPELHDPFAAEAGHDQAPARVSDPLQPVNRALFQFNDKLYFWVLKPVSKGYGTVAPEPFRQSVKRMFVNLRYPVRLVNNLLQGKFKRAGIETARFLVNSTVGIGGLFDPAQEEWQLQPYVEDLDQTLGFYRLPTGPYLNWPIFGPSSIRGTVGLVGDSFLSPLHYLEDAVVTIGTRAGDTVNSTSLRLGEYEDFKRDTFDPYIALRDAYLENRRALVAE